MLTSLGTQARKHPAARRTTTAAAIVVSVLLAASFLTGTPTSASTPSFVAVGSAEQVYVTGLAPSAQASLVTASGKTLYTQTADSLGGLLFVNVPPGGGYRVQLSSDGQESPPLTVHTDASAPWDPSIYKQTITDNGYQYLTT